MDRPRTGQKTDIPWVFVVIRTGDFSSLLEAAISARGYRVKILHGEKALTAGYRELEPHLIFYVLENWSDWETIRRLREEDPSARVAVLDMKSDPEAKRVAASMSCAAYIENNAGGDALVRKIQTVLNKYPAYPVAPWRKILVVDDEESIRAVFKRHFTKKGFYVHTASNGPQAVALFEQERPNLVLLDILLPEKDGLYVLKTIRSMDRSVPIVMLTGYDEREMSKETLKLGANDYVLKPFNLHDLEIKLALLLKETATAA